MSTSRLQVHGRAQRHQGRGVERLLGDRDGRELDRDHEPRTPREHGQRLARREDLDGSNREQNGVGDDPRDTRVQQHLQHREARRNPAGVARAAPGLLHVRRVSSTFIEIDCVGAPKTRSWSAAFDPPAGARGRRVRVT